VDPANSCFLSESGIRGTKNAARAALSSLLVDERVNGEKARWRCKTALVMEERVSVKSMQLAPIMMQSVIAIKATAVLDLVKGLRGVLHVSCEEGTYSACSMTRWCDMWRAGGV